MSLLTKRGYHKIIKDLVMCLPLLYQKGEFTFSIKKAVTWLE